jgi:hypothetical protein
VLAGYLISSAEDMTHYLVSQLNGGRYDGTSVLSPDGIGELHRPAVQTPEAETSYGMAWLVGPRNDIPAIHHQGETFNFHANVVLLPQSQTGIVVLMNAENSVDLFTTGRMGTIADGVTSLLEGQDPRSPRSNVSIFIVYAALFALLVLQARGIAKSVVALRRGRIRRGRIGPWWRIGLSLVLSLVWACSSSCSCRSSWACRFRSWPLSFLTSSTCCLPARWWHSAGPSSRRSGPRPPVAESKLRTWQRPRASTGSRRLRGTSPRSRSREFARRGRVIGNRMPLAKTAEGVQRGAFSTGVGVVFRENTTRRHRAPAVRQ